MDGDVPMKPRIAILTNYPADFTTFTGGVETATAALLEGLREYQAFFEFHVVSAPQGLAKDLQIEREGFYFHFISVPNFPLARPRALFRVAKGLHKLRELAPDLVHCMDNMNLALAAIFSGYSKLFTVHGIKRHEAKKRTGWERWSASADAIIERHIYRQFQSFICISDYTCRMIGDKKKLYSIPNPVRSIFFKVRRNKLFSSPVLLFVGGLIPLKRPMDLLNAHNELRQQFPMLETVFCGVSETTDYLREMQQQAVDGIHFVGRVGEKELMGWLSQATVLVLPSAQENSPIVIAEAMAAGVPVVATRVGGVPEMVEHEQTGFLYDIGDINSLVKWLGLLLSNPVLQEEMGQKARQKAINTYHPTLIAQQTIKVYRKILEGKVSKR
jgi:glycosyltransferase involved in cell wall biosynthesis